MDAGTFIAPAGDTIVVEGDFNFHNGDLSGGGTFDCDGGSTSSTSCARGGDMNLNFSGNQQQQVTQITGSVWPDGSIDINKSGQELIYMSPINQSNGGQLTNLISGTINMNSFNWDLTGDLTLDSGSVLAENGGVLSVNGTFTDNR